DFLCEDPKCRNIGVRVTAVNHWRVPEEDPLFRAPHYRVLDKHHPDCFWAQLSSADDEDETVAIQPPETRRIRPALETRLVPRFYPPAIDEPDIGASPIELAINRIRAIPDPMARRSEMLGYLRGEGASATSLEALVSCYEELKTVRGE